MPQQYLDPAKAHKTTKTWLPDFPIPISIRSFGYCPNFNNWLPGDLILVSAISPNFTQRSIRTVQTNGGYPHEHARWEHAAVYIGSGALCEANRNGVVVNDIFQYIGHHLIRIRRNNSLSSDERWSLAVNALKLQKYSYSYASILELLWKANTVGFWKGAKISFPKRTLICSELYADAHTKASDGIVLGNIKSGEITPASLSLENKLTDVSSNWLKIV